MNLPSRFSLTISSLRPTKEQIKAAIEDETPRHQPSRLSAAGLGYPCMTCDELWPCSVAIIIAALGQQTDGANTIYDSLRALSDDPEMGPTVFRAWHDIMVHQRREVGTRTDWSKLSPRDRVLDQYIAAKLIERALDIIQGEERPQNGSLSRFPL